MQYCYIDSPIGPLLAAAEADTLNLLSFPEGSRKRSPEAHWVENETPFETLRQQLQEYFAGECTAFDLALAPPATPFQRLVLDALRTIPYGETRSYGEIARQIGRPTASRAVGAANGANPIPIIIPCHRVIGSTGQLTGFGGGLDTKRFLLGLEQGTPDLFASA